MRRLAVFRYKDKKMGKLKGCICSARVGEKKSQGDTTRKGINFSPLWAFVVSVAKCKKNCVSGKAVFPPSERVLEKRRPSQLKCGYSSPKAEEEMTEAAA